MVGAQRKKSAFEGLKGLRSQADPLSVLQSNTGNQETGESELAKMVHWSEITLAEKQPRRYFDKTDLESLAASIREHGILEPLIVRPLADGHYGLVAGERRYRAARLANIEHIPVVIRVLNDEQAWELALLENVQRQNLNAVDRVDAVLQELAFKLGCSVLEAKSVLYRLENENKGKVTRHESGSEGANVTRHVSGNTNRTTVERVFEVLGIRFSHFMRFELPLINAPEPILAAVRAGKVDVRHANEIKRVKDQKQQQALLDEAIEKQLSVEEVKARVRTVQGKDESLHDALQGKLTKILARAKRSEVWSCVKRRSQLEELLITLEQLIGEY